MGISIYIFFAATVYEPGASEQHGPADPEWLLVYQPLQHRPCTEQCHGTLSICSAQLYLRCSLAFACHPLQHRLPRPTQLRRVFPTVEHRQVGYLDGKSRGALVTKVIPKCKDASNCQDQRFQFQHANFIVECLTLSKRKRAVVPFGEKSLDLPLKHPPWYFSHRVPACIVFM